jgi:hypothetical protein
VPLELERLITAVEDGVIDLRYEPGSRLLDNVARVVREDGAITESGEIEPVSDSRLESMRKRLVEGDTDGARAVFWRL